MSELTLTQLKILVERAVRPVRASSGRKRKMREELLAHVNAVFDEEAKLGDEKAALEQVAARFGTPADLAQRLQESVAVGDRIPWLVEQLVGFPARESMLRRAARHAFLVGGMCTVFSVITILVDSNRSQWLTAARAPALFVGITLGFLNFGGTLITGAMRQALDGPRGPSWPLVSLVAAAAGLFIPATTFLFCLAFSGDVGPTFWHVLPSAPLGVLAPLALALVVRMSHSEFRYDQEWAGLKID
jgi:hypothetical protein